MRLHKNLAPCVAFGLLQRPSSAVRVQQHQQGVTEADMILISPEKGYVCWREGNFEQGSRRNRETGQLGNRVESWDSRGFQVQVWRWEHNFKKQVIHTKNLITLRTGLPRCATSNGKQRRKIQGSRTVQATESLRARMSLRKNGWSFSHPVKVERRAAMKS